MKLVGYARQSKTDRAKVPSTEWQIAEIRRWAEHHDHQLVHARVDEDRSGYSGVARAGFDQALRDLVDPDIDGVVVWRLDRLSRQGQWGPDVLRFMESRGHKALCSVVEDVDTSTAAGELVLGVRMSMAKGESEAIASRWKRAKRTRSEAGKPNTGGHRPFGHSPDRLTVDPAEAELIREAASRVIAGESLRGIVLDWNARPIPTTTGGTWSNQALRNLLLQSRLTGKLTYGGAVVAEDVWSPILDEVTAARVEAVLRDPSRRPGEKARKYLLSGLVRCGRCDRRLHGKRTTGGVKYGCPMEPQGCGALTVSAVRAEAEVEARFLAAAADGKIPLPGDTHLDATSIGEQIDANQRAREEAAGDYYARLIDRPTYLTVLDRLERKDTGLRSVAADAERTRRRLAMPTGAKNWATLTVDQRRALLGSVVERVVIAPRPGGATWDPSRVAIEWRR